VLKIFLSKGADVFKAKINIEVQWIMSELTIAAIEKNGGMITTKFYDRECVRAMSDPYKHFMSGKPIPKNDTPPLNSIDYYTSAVNRGYLASPEQIRLERLSLAQKYGYQLTDLSTDEKREMFERRKDPRQIWYGLEPGWVVNLNDKVVLKPADKEWIEYYKN
jgi:large subunit ribosomal protein L15